MIFVFNLPKSIFYFFYLQMESSFGKDFSIVAKLALSGSSLSHGLIKRGGGEGEPFIFIPSPPPPPPPPPMSLYCRPLPPLLAVSSARAQVPSRAPPVAAPCTTLPAIVGPVSIVLWPSRDLPCSLLSPEPPLP